MMDRLDSRRVFLALSILVQAIMLGFMSGRTVFAVFASLVALVMLFGPWRFRLHKRRALALAMSLALLFLLKARFTAIDAFPGAHEPFPYAYRYLVCQYALLLQVALLAVWRQDGGVSPLAFLLGVVVFVYGGNTMYAGGGAPNELTVRVYRWLGLCQGAVLATMASLAFRRTRGWEPEPAKRGRLVWHFGLVLGVLALAWVGGEMTVWLNRYAMSALERFQNGSAYGRSSQGFSRSTWLGSVAHWKGRASDEIALRVYSDTTPGYLRGAVFIRYTSDTRPGWETHRVGRNVLPDTDAPSWISDHSPDPVFRVGEGNASKYKGPGSLHEMRIHQAAQADDALFGPAGVRWMSARVEHIRVDTYGCIALHQLPSGGRYRLYVDPDLPVEEPDAREREEYLEVGDDLARKLQGLADSVVGDAATNAEKIARVVRFFRENFTYRFGITIPEHARGDPLTYFLTERPSAHCEYFATGAAILLRLAGVPCRFVSGFVVEERNPVGDYWVARNRDAHAWVEAWDPERGWILAEATPSQGLPGWEGDRKDRRWEWRFDAWRQRLREFWAYLASGGLKRTVTTWLVALRDAWREMSVSSRFAGAVLPVVLLMAWMWWRRRRSRRRSPRLRSTRAFRDLLRRMDRRLARRQLRRAPAETLHRFAQRIRIARPEGIDTELAARWYESYAEMRYRGRIDEAGRNELARRMPK